MFGLRKKQKEKSNFLDVFKKFFFLKKEGNSIEGKTIKNWNVFPDLPKGNIIGRKDRAVICLYFTDGTKLILNTSDCNIEISVSNIE